MPSAAPRSCPAPGCPELVTRARPCPQHPPRPSGYARISTDRRPSAARRGYDRQWRNLRAAVITHAPPMCAVCSVTFPLELHHVVPLRLGGAHDVDNVVWLCPKHHHEQTRRLR